MLYSWVVPHGLIKLIEHPVSVLISMHQLCEPLITRMENILLVGLL